MAQLPQTIYNWLLNERMLSPEVIKKAGLHFNEDTGEVAIPVYDEDNNFLFNKYRRNPNKTDGPKYRYDAGASVALYNIQTLKSNDTVVICEGEFDALVLESNGIAAVSSTGGTGTFKQEWVEWFDRKHVFICQDSDEAGIKGALKILTYIKHASIIMLPDGQDITDLYRNGESIEPHIEQSQWYRMPEIFDQRPETQAELKKSIKFDSMTADGLLSEYNQKRTLFSKIYLNIWVDSYKTKQRMLKSMKIVNAARNDPGMGDKIQRAKQVPIDGFLQFNRQKRAKCLWHDDSDPSMYYYEKDNRVKCFSCGQHGDVIDVVQKLENCTFLEAINKILNI